MFISECTAHCIAISCTSLKGTSDFNIYPVSLQEFTFEPLYTGYIYLYQIYVRIFNLHCTFTSNHAACFICRYN